MPVIVVAVVIGITSGLACTAGYYVGVKDGEEAVLEKVDWLADKATESDVKLSGKNWKELMRLLSK